MADPASRLRETYPSISRFLISPLVDFLAAARSCLEGDLDRALILLVVALRTAEDPKFGQVRMDDVLSGKVETYPSLLTNVRSVAESTGIARETVRRKAHWLIEKGWLSRVGDRLSLTPRASRELVPLREAMLDAAVRLHALVEKTTKGGR